MKIPIENSKGNLKHFTINNRLAGACDLMIKRSLELNMDNVVIIDGGVGLGKSNMAATILGYISYKTGIPYTIDNVFFEYEPMFKFASTTEKQIIHFDEAALLLLASDWQKKEHKAFLKFLMLCRKKGHIIVICIPNFSKLNQYIIMDRVIALIHMYQAVEKDNPLYVRAFRYHQPHQFRPAYEYSKRSGISPKYETMPFSIKDWIKSDSQFPLYSLIGEKEYEDKKDQAILKIDDGLEIVKTEINYRKLLDLRRTIATKIKMPREELAKIFEVNVRTLSRWANSGYVIQKDTDDNPDSN